MPSTVIRPFQRSDREQVTDLVNAHIGAALPGRLGVGQRGHEPARARAERGDRRPVGERAGDARGDRARARRSPPPICCATPTRSACRSPTATSVRSAGSSACPQNESAGDALVAACTAQLTGWQVSRQAADVSLPCPCCYGVPDCWPHLKALFERGGFRHDGPTEVILAADVRALPEAAGAPFPGVTLRREMGGPAVATHALRRVARRRADRVRRPPGRPDARRHALAARGLGRARFALRRRRVSPPRRGDVADRPRRRLAPPRPRRPADRLLRARADRRAGVRGGRRLARARCARSAAGSGKHGAAPRRDAA